MAGYHSKALKKANNYFRDEPNLIKIIGTDYETDAYTQIRYGYQSINVNSCINDILITYI